jgi:hypothetical protein
MSEMIKNNGIFVPGNLLLARARDDSNSRIMFVFSSYDDTENRRFTQHYLARSQSCALMLLITIVEQNNDYWAMVSINNPLIFDGDLLQYAHDVLMTGWINLCEELAHFDFENVSHEIR